MLISENIRCKIRRALEQTNALERRFERFYKRESDSVVQEIDAQKQEKCLVFRGRAIPPVWSVIIGEIVHDLRSALDHAIYDLTIAHEGHPLRMTEFPVFEDERKYFATDRSGMPRRDSGIFKIRGISPQAKAVVERMQPFRIQQPDREPIISLVHKLNIVDKHRTLNVCRMNTTQGGWRVLRDIHPITLTVVAPEIEPGTELVRWKPAGPFDSQVDMKGSVTFEIAFGDSVPSIRRQPVIKVCRGLIRGTSRILDEFDKLSS